MPLPPGASERAAGSPASAGHNALVRIPEAGDPTENRFTDDRIWGVHADELGVEYVAWIDAGALS